MSTQKGKGAGTGGGTSKLDNTSAAATHYLLVRGMKNPFHSASVKSMRKSLASVKSAVFDVKAKAGESCSGLW